MKKKNIYLLKKKIPDYGTDMQTWELFIKA